MELIGHRGCGAQYPENTVLAVREASRRLDAVEIDVRRCGSGELVAFHDERVDRVTDAEGPLEAFTRAELAELDVCGSSEPVPLVADVLDAVPRGVTIQIELKEPGLAEDLGTLLGDRPAEFRVSSFLPSALAEVRDAGWDAATGFLFGDDPAENVDRAVALGCEYAHPHHELCVESDVVERSRNEDLGVLAWNTDDPAVVEEMRRLGVDGITADRWDIGSEARAAEPRPN
jgi:glycerophosphoryl diester phosphodiesterase